MMTASWQKIRLPILERLAVADLADRLGKSEEDILIQLIRDAVKREIASSRTTENEPDGGRQREEASER